MLTNLQRLLLLTVLFSLVAAGHLPSANFFFGGIWEASKQAEFALLEEEVESESEHQNDLFQNDGSDDGGGGDDEIGITKSPSNDSSLEGLRVCDFQVWNLQNTCKSLSKVQIEAKAHALSTAYRLPLFLLFHNIKSDLAHIAA